LSCQRAREPRGRDRDYRTGVRCRRSGPGGRHARRLCRDPHRPAAGARRDRARAGQVRDRGARRRSPPREAAEDLPEPGPPGARPPRRGRSRGGGRSAGGPRPADEPQLRFSAGPDRAVTFARIAHSIVLSWGWRRILIAFVAGAATALALPPLSIWPIPFLTF